MNQSCKSGYSSKMSTKSKNIDNTEIQLVEDDEESSENGSIGKFSKAGMDELVADLAEEERLAMIEKRKFNNYDLIGLANK